MLTIITRSLVLLLFFISLTVVCSAKSLQVSSSPSIVLIFVDDLGYGDLGCYGATQIFTAKMMSPAITGGKATHLLYRDEEFGDTLAEKAIQRMRTLWRFLSRARLDGWRTHEDARRTEASRNDVGDLNQRQRRMLNEGGQEAWKAGHRLNGNLFAFEFDAWEGGHRIPFISRWPSKIEAGSESSQQICLIDMLATFASMTGTRLSEQDGHDSFDILPAMLRQPDAPTSQLNIHADAPVQTHKFVREHPAIAGKLQQLLIECQKTTRTAPAPH